MASNLQDDPLIIRNKAALSALIALQLLSFNAPLAAKTGTHYNITKINSALKKAPLDSRLNFLAGLAYETNSVMGTDQREMARVGYRMALKNDPSFWPAHVQLGFMAMDDRDAVSAQEQFSAAAAINPDEPIIYYALARAAFCAGDLQVADTSWKRAIQLRTPQSVEELITGAAIERQKGQVDAAEIYVTQIKKMGKAVPRMALQAPRAVEPNDATGILTAQTAQTDSKMGMVDLIILRRDEQQFSASGINLLDALSLQFGSNLVNSSWRSSRDRLAGAVTSSTLDTDRSLSVTVPSVTYSINIANASGGKSTVQAQQAVLIYDGEKSSVQIGSTLTYNSSGSLSGSSSTMQDGLTLNIGSQFIDQDRVKLTIDASLEDFVPGASAGSFEESVLKERTATSVTATLKFGETILISSGEQSVNSRASDATPLLGSIPILGKLFNSRDNYTSDVSVLVLLTLRPRGSFSLPHENDLERRNFETMRKRLLDQLDTGGDEPSHHRFKPDQSSLRYTLDNPARAGDKSYLSRAGVLGVI
jgi:tetratricopeptide (TPR) repeat protein